MQKIKNIKYETNRTGKIIKFIFKKYIIKTPNHWVIEIYKITISFMPKPFLLSLWWKWLLSGKNGDKLLLILEYKTCNISRIGSVNRNKGTNKIPKLSLKKSLSIIFRFKEIVLQANNDPKK